MRAESLQEVIHAQPFRAFTLMSADGTRLHVPHPRVDPPTPGRRQPRSGDEPGR